MQNSNYNFAIDKFFSGKFSSLISSGYSVGKKEFKYCNLLLKFAYHKYGNTNSQVANRLIKEKDIIINKNSLTNGHIFVIYYFLIKYSIDIHRVFYSQIMYIYRTHKDNIADIIKSLSQLVSDTSMFSDKRANIEYCDKITSKINVELIYRIWEVCILGDESSVEFKINIKKKDTMSNSSYGDIEPYYKTYKFIGKYFYKDYVKEDLGGQAEYKIYAYTSKLTRFTPNLLNCYNCCKMVQNVTRIITPKVIGVKSMETMAAILTNLIEQRELVLKGGKSDSILVYRSTLNRVQILLFEFLYTMSILRTVGVLHGDLHIGNMLVSNTEPYYLKYLYGSEQFYIKSDFNLKIFDYDRSSKIKGDIIFNYFTHNVDKSYTGLDINNNIYPDLCEYLGQCNTASAHHDFVFSLSNGVIHIILELIIGLASIRQSSTNLESLAAELAVLRDTLIDPNYTEIVMNGSQRRYKAIKINRVYSSSKTNNLPPDTYASKYTPEFFLLECGLFDELKIPFDSTLLNWTYMLPSNTDIGKIEDDKCNI